MENYFLEKEISLICVEAESFPEGVMAAHEKLHSLLPEDGRMYYGLSRPNGDGRIVYKAAAEEVSIGEAEKLDCETFLLEKGTYISILIADFYNHVAAIGNAFQQLIADPGIDPNGICVEMYVNEKDVRCMVKMKD